MILTAAKPTVWAVIVRTIGANDSVVTISANCLAESVKEVKHCSDGERIAGNIAHVGIGKSCKLSLECFRKLTVFIIVASKNQYARTAVREVRDFRHVSAWRQPRRLDAVR